MTENLPALPNPEENAAHNAALAKQRWILAGIIIGATFYLVELLVLGAGVLEAAGSPKYSK